jgi:hypothetical protein
VPCGFEFLGLAFEGASDGFKFVGQLEACDSLRQTKAPFGLTTQSIREPRWFAVERGESER